MLVYNIETKLLIEADQAFLDAKAAKNDPPNWLAFEGSGLIDHTDTEGRRRAWTQAEIDADDQPHTQYQADLQAIKDAFPSMNPVQKAIIRVLKYKFKDIEQKLGE